MMNRLFLCLFFLLPSVDALNGRKAIRGSRYGESSSMEKVRKRRLMMKDDKEEQIGAQGKDSFEEELMVIDSTKLDETMEPDKAKEDSVVEEDPPKKAKQTSSTEGTTKKDSGKASSQKVSAKGQPKDAKITKKAKSQQMMSMIGKDQAMDTGFVSGDEALMESTPEDTEVYPTAAPSFAPGDEGETSSPSDGEDEPSFGAGLPIETESPQVDETEAPSEDLPEDPGTSLPAEDGAGLPIETPPPQVVETAAPSEDLPEDPPAVLPPVEQTETPDQVTATPTTTTEDEVVGVPPPPEETVPPGDATVPEGTVAPSDEGGVVDVAGATVEPSDLSSFVPS